MSEKALQDLFLIGLLVIVVALIVELTVAKIFNYENKKNNKLYIQSKYNHYGYLYPQYAKKYLLNQKN